MGLIIDHVFFARMKNLNPVWGQALRSVFVSELGVPSVLEAVRFDEVVVLLSLQHAELVDERSGNCDARHERDIGLVSDGELLDGSGGLLDLVLHGGSFQREWDLIIALVFFANGFTKKSHPRIF